MSRYTGVLSVLSVLALVMLFARWNGGERVTVDLGFYTFYHVPLTYVAFGGLFLGMLVMLAAGIHSDLKVRHFLRERLREEDRVERERIDRYQQDLFVGDEEEGEVTP